MSKLSAAGRSELVAMFGPRVCFRLFERRLAARDAAWVPALVRLLGGSAVPEAVVQPETEEEVAALLRWAVDRGVRITPRGRGTGSHGGAVPVRGGLVVDLGRLRRVLAVDAAARRATVEAGVTWESLDRELARRGLAPRLAPTDTPGATMGGWLAEDGAGVGSFEAGWFRDNVLRARLVLADGTPWELASEDLELAAGAGGTTGILTRLTLRVQPLQELHVLAAACPDAHALEHLAYMTADQRLPVWSVSFLSPRMAERVNQAGAVRPLLPAAHVALLVARAMHRSLLEARLPALLRSCQAERLADEAAEALWRERFRVAALGRLAAACVPADTVVPLPAFGDVANAIQREVTHPLASDGLVVRGEGTRPPEAVLHGLLLDEEGRPGPTEALTLARRVVGIAERHGGRAAAAGLLFADRAEQVLGARRARRLLAFKRQEDPGGRMNPAKAFGDVRLRSALRAADALGPLTRPAARLAGRAGAAGGSGTRLPEQVVAAAARCARCGACLEACPQFRGWGWESRGPRGRWLALRDGARAGRDWERRLAESLAGCGLCQRCQLACPAGLPDAALWLDLRRHLAERRGRAPSPLLDLLARCLAREGTLWLTPRDERAAWMSKKQAQDHAPRPGRRTVYFAGCTASIVEQDVAKAAVRVLEEAGEDFAVLGPRESCCGYPALLAGEASLFADLLRKNLEALKSLGAETLVTSCARCHWVWSRVAPAWADALGLPQPLQVRHITEVLAEHLEAGALDLPRKRRKVAATWHDPCHLREAALRDAPRRILAALPHVQLTEMSRAPETAPSCGGLAALLADPAAAAEAARAVLEDATATGARVLLTSCPDCELALRAAAARLGSPIEVVDLVRLVGNALGRRFPLPDEAVARHGKLLGALHELLSPEGLAAVLRTRSAAWLEGRPRARRLATQAAARVPGLRRVAAAARVRRLARQVPGMTTDAMGEGVARLAEQAELTESQAQVLGELLPGVLTRLAREDARHVARLLAAEPPAGRDEG